MSQDTRLRDMAKCDNGEKCARRMTCVRWIAPAADEYQVFAAFYVEGAECEGYWPTQEESA